MRETSFYPQGAAEVEHVETHISHVFLVGALVYKVKKAVRFSFLNYSTLARRRHFLQEELRLNRRLAPSVYLGILPISRVPGRWQLGDGSDPVEYALVMRRLPARRMLDFLIEHDQLTESMMVSLADLLASFHGGSAAGGKVNAREEPEVVARVWNDNLADLRPFMRGSDAEFKFKTLQDFGARFISSHRDLMTRRIGEGRIREGHGDLHCEHICFAPEGIQIFDCVEFSPALRSGDVASEIAFLVMDMESRGGVEPARVFLDHYVDVTGDRDLPALLPLYRAYRALVRAKVNAFRSGAFSETARRYFDYACRCATLLRQPFIAVICGLSGTGKSTLARALSDRLGLPVISSDTTRKSFFGLADGTTEAGYEEGIYRAAKTEVTYELMALAAEAILSRHQAVVLDGTFQRKAQRARVRRLAEARNVPLIVLQCTASEKVIRARLSGRAEMGTDLSDAGWDIYLKQKTAFEPLHDIPENILLTLDTDAPVSELVRKVEVFLSEALATVPQTIAESTS